MRPRGLIGPLCGLLLWSLLAAAATAQEPVPASDCAICHEEEAEAFTTGPHGRAMARLSEQTLEGSCEVCHGPGAQHLEELSAETIQKVPDSRACLTCHSGAAAKIEILSAGHNRFGVRCLDCHDPGHADTGVEKLLLDEPRRMCATCHLDVAGAFRLPFAHRNGREGFQCTACHSTHGDNRVGRLNLLSGDGACNDCHIGKTRPFVFPHPPVARPGCVACHMPHGSTNPRLLTRRNIDLLCLECHASAPAFHDVSQARYRLCTTCHAAVHGSNRDPRLIEE